MIKDESVTLTEVLENREDRVCMQAILLEKYKNPLVSFTINIPGPIKLNELSRKVYLYGIVQIEQALEKAELQINTVIKVEKKTGFEALYSVNAEPLLLKKITCQIEDKNEIGRLFDMDIIGLDGIPLSRRSLNLPERKCLICNKSAVVCARARNHSLDKLNSKIAEIAENLK